MEDYFQNTPHCTSSCSDRYSYITYYGIWGTKLCNQYCQYYMEMPDGKNVEKICKEQYECKAIVSRPETNNNQCYKDKCPDDYPYAYINTKQCMDKCDLYARSDLEGTSDIADYTCYSDFCPNYARYKIQRQNGVECVQICESDQFLDGDTCVGSCPPERPVKYKQLIESLGKIQIRCVETCSTSLFSTAGTGLVIRAYLHSDNFCNSTPCAVSEPEHIFGQYDATRTYQKCKK